MKAAFSLAAGLLLILVVHTDACGQNKAGKPDVGRYVMKTVYDRGPTYLFDTATGKLWTLEPSQGKLEWQRVEGELPWQGAKPVKGRFEFSWLFEVYVFDTATSRTWRTSEWENLGDNRVSAKWVEIKKRSNRKPGVPTVPVDGE